jgi:nondiscriminating glutamyl-tRNA synthetase
MRTRFAPSPTGSLHIGNARIAVLNWLCSRQAGGAFLLRIEDTDTARNVEGSEEDIFRDLRWLGLDWDEGPPFENRPPIGLHAPYRQSERMDIYRSAAHQLHARGFVYECFCTDDELAATRSAAESGEGAARYDGRCDRLSTAERDALRAAGRMAALRFRVPARDEILVRDVIHGDVRFPAREISDFIVLRADGRATYNFAVVVDDIQMEITHVIRGAGHLSNTPRQVLLYEAFGRAAPIFAHVPTVLGPDRQKLSKRHGAQALSEYRREGYHADAMVNYLSLLSWSSPTGEEVLTRAQLVREITLERVGASDVVYDPAKLRWLSSKHIERMPLPDLLAALEPFLGPVANRIAESRLPMAVEAVRSHLTTFGEIEEQLAPFFATDDTTVWPPETPLDVAVLRAALAELSRDRAWERPDVESAIKAAGTHANARGKDLYRPLRLALTGREHGPPLWAVLLVQGREPVLKRLQSSLHTSAIVGP